MAELFRFPVHKNKYGSSLWFSKSGSLLFFTCDLHRNFSRLPKGLREVDFVGFNRPSKNRFKAIIRRALWGKDLIIEVKEIRKCNGHFINWLFRNNDITRILHKNNVAVGTTCYIQLEYEAPPLPASPRQN